MTLLLTLLPTLLRLVNWILDKSGATADEKKKVTALIVASKDDAQTSIQIKDEFKDLRDRLKERMKQKKAAP